jgi:hypothetical protein
MSSLVLSGDTSGTVSLSVPAVAGSNTLTIQAGTGTNSMNTLATAVPSTSGTSIDFTSLPSWIKKITVMFSGVSTNGSAYVIVQLGAGSLTTSGYIGEVGQLVNGSSSFTQAYSSGFIIEAGTNAAATRYGSLVFTLIGSNIWVGQGNVARGDSTNISVTGGGITLGGTLDRVRITTSNGTDAFDAGNVNILYEG